MTKQRQHTYHAPWSTHKTPGAPCKKPSAKYTKNHIVTEFRCRSQSVLNIAIAIPPITPSWTRRFSKASPLLFISGISACTRKKRVRRRNHSAIDLAHTSMSTILIKSIVLYCIYCACYVSSKHYHRRCQLQHTGKQKIAKYTAVAQKFVRHPKTKKQRHPPNQNNHASPADALHEEQGLHVLVGAE